MVSSSGVGVVGGGAGVGVVGDSVGGGGKVGTVIFCRRRLLFKKLPTVTFRFYFTICI